MLYEVITGRRQRHQPEGLGRAGVAAVSGLGVAVVAVLAGEARLGEALGAAHSYNFV